MLLNPSVAMLRRAKCARFTSIQLPFTDTHAVKVSKNKRVKDPLEKSIDCAKFPTGFLGRSILTLGVKAIFTHTGDRWFTLKLGGTQHAND
jgi:hypothetical protein